MFVCNLSHPLRFINQHQAAFQIPTKRETERSRLCDTRKRFCAINFRIPSVFSMQFTTQYIFGTPVFERVALWRDLGATNLVFTTLDYGVCHIRHMRGVDHFMIILKIMMIIVMIIMIISTWLSYLYVLLGPRQGSPGEPSAANYSCYSRICCRP